MTLLEPTRSVVTRRVLASDPRLSYLIHVPPVRSPEPRLVVSVHGASRNIDMHARLLSAYSEMYGAVLLVPHFSAIRFPDYQRLGRIGRGRRADLAMHLMVAEVAAQTGITVDRFHLFGFSAGAQFVHRYTMAHPHRVAFAVIANAGRYTLPDPEQRFPRGIRTTRKLTGLRFEPEAFLRVPMKVFVGKEEADDEVITLPRRSPQPDRETAAARTERARRWVAAMQEAGRSCGVESAITCEELPDRIRSFRSSVLRAGLAERAFEAMFGAPLPIRSNGAAPTPDV